VITNNMLAGKFQVGYVGDMPAIVATTKRSQADIRIVSVTSFNNQQCDLFVVRSDAPDFKTPQDALKWMDGKRVAVPKGSCTDRFAQEVFKRAHVVPAEYLNQSIEVIATNLRAGNLDAAVIWEPNVAHVGEIVGNKTARLVSTGADWNQHDTGLIIVTKDFLDQNRAAVVGLLKADIEAQQFIVSGYPTNACDVAGYAVSDTTGFEKKEMWYALYGRPPVGDPKARAVRFQAHLVFDDPVRTFLKSASDFLQAANIISSPMPNDAILDDPLGEAVRALKVKAPLGETQTHTAADYPCG
jgi:NitT/TauT family transport system substrate-binding protein